jgi:hypothetical protein
MADVGAITILDDFGENAELTQMSAGTADMPGFVIGDLDGIGRTTFTKYTMVGTDASNATRDTWDVLGFDDPTAAQYTGGLTLPLRDVHIIGTRVQ